MDAEKKLKIYHVVIARYKDLIAEKESHSISTLRQRVSPYNDIIRNIRDNIVSNIIGYQYRKDFFTAAQEAINHIRRIETCEFTFTFWMDFKDMEELRVGTAYDKAIYLTAILRSLGSDDARVLVTKKDIPYVRFLWDNSEYLFSPQSGSLLLGDDQMKLFIDDPVAYSFNDLVYENYEP
ncbi:hypothetical protein JXA56_04890 [Candidatus Micrarchaeota archaeon]|nr:hypothetical protein [Candidatus Micrarchaeota archaeon]